VVGKLSVTSIDDNNSCLLVKSRSSKFDPLVGADTPCSRQKSSITEHNKDELLSEHFAEGNIPGRLKSPPRKIEELEGSNESEC